MWNATNRCNFKFKFLYFKHKLNGHRLSASLFHTLRYFSLLLSVIVMFISVITIQCLYFFLFCGESRENQKITSPAQSRAEGSVRHLLTKNSLLFFHLPFGRYAVSRLNGSGGHSRWFFLVKWFWECISRIGKINTWQESERNTQPRYKSDLVSQGLPWVGESKDN